MTENEIEQEKRKLDKRIELTKIEEQKRENRRKLNMVEYKGGNKYRFTTCHFAVVDSDYLDLEGQ